MTHSNVWKNWNSNRSNKRLQKQLRLKSKKHRLKPQKLRLRLRKSEDSTKTTDQAINNSSSK